MCTNYKCTVHVMIIDEILLYNHNLVYCDLRGRIKENAEALHHVLHSSSREQSHIARACIMSLILHARAL